MKVKLSIIIFTIILSVFYFQIISCKNPEKPEAVYSNYTGIVDPSPHMPSMYDIIDYEFRQFIVKEGLEEYRVMLQSDIDKLNEYAADYTHITGSKSKVDIRCLGSQNYVEDWLGKIGVAFSSPPYFNLEDYCIGDQSYKPGMTYNDWLENYLRPTIKNIKLYLVWGGYFIINIKNTKKYPMATDAQRIAAEEGFTLVATEPVVNIKRINCKTTLNDNDELCYVFQEKEYINEKN